MSLLLDNFNVLLLDMNGTFMFGHDRFGAAEDYFHTYRELGGRRLDRDTLQQTMHASCDALLAMYDDPARFDDFPSLAEVFREHGRARDEDISILERLFAAHEIGHVPPEHDACLRRLATTHHLGVVSNICAHPDIWLAGFGPTSVLHLFRSLTFSSEGRSIKPSRVLFERALADVPSVARVLFIGDSLERDMIPAKALGLSTAWLAAEGADHQAADYVVPSLPSLATVAA